METKNVDERIRIILGLEELQLQKSLKPVDAARAVLRSEFYNVINKAEKTDLMAVVDKNPAHAIIRLKRATAYALGAELSENPSKEGIDSLINAGYNRIEAQKRL
ncbi:hypothetical protein HY643_04110 [Candidatus Woesearchaeota archaeon]|nr:hypothetical protein [Candidatus Woesearchaeota archaeon]